MYTFSKERSEELSNRLKEILTEEEKKLLYAACMGMADELSAMSKRYQGLLVPSNDLTDRAGELYVMANCLMGSMEEETVKSLVELYTVDSESNGK